MARGRFDCDCFDYMTEEVIREMNKHVRVAGEIFGFQFRREDRGFVINKYHVDLYGRENLELAFKAVASAMDPSKVAWYWWDGPEMVIAAEYLHVAEKRSATAAERCDIAWQAAGASLGFDSHV